MKPNTFRSPVLLLAFATLTALGVACSTQAFVQLPEFQLAFVDLNGDMKAVGMLPINAFAPRLSPDGNQLAVDTTAGEVWIYRLSNGNFTRERRLDGRNRYPMWSGNGERLLYVSNDGPEPAIFWRQANGEGLAERLTQIARAPESWSDRNNMISFIMLTGSDYDIWLYSFRDKKAAPLIEIPASAQHSSHFSPDGRWIAYTSNESGAFEVYVQPYPLTGAKYRVTRSGGGHPLWSPDGKTIFFDNAGRLYSAGIQTQPSFRAEDPVPLPIQGFIQAEGNNRRQYDRTPDGKQFVMMFPPRQ